MTPAFLLIASLLPLVAGPYLARWADRSPSACALTSGFVTVSLAGLVLFHVWPHAFGVAGWPALAVGLAGVVLPQLFHGRHKLADERRALPALLALGLLALAAHAAIDGFVLFGTGDAHSHGHDESSLWLALAVVLHRLPMALAVWWLARPTLGSGVAISLLLAIGGATLIGYAAAGTIRLDLGTADRALFEAGIGGLLLHAASPRHGHRHDHEGHEHPAHEHPAHEHSHGFGDEGSPALRRLKILGGLAGGALLLALALIHPFEIG